MKKAVCFIFLFLLSQTLDAAARLLEKSDSEHSESIDAWQARPRMIHYPDTVGMNHFQPPPASPSGDVFLPYPPQPIEELDR